MDVFVEQMVKRKKGTADYLVIAGTVLLGLLILAATMLVPFLAQLGLFLLAGVGYGIYYVASTRNLEYEYSTTNGDFTIDKIINRRSRKRVCSFDLKAVEEMGRFNAEAMHSKTFAKTLRVGVDDAGTDAWYVTVHLKDFGNSLVVFNPDERLLAAMKPFLPRQVAVHAFRGN